MSNYKGKRKNNLKSIILVLLVIASVVALGAGVMSLTKNETKKIGVSAFSIGSLDENGEYVEDKTALYTKEAFSCLDLRVEPEFDFQGTYDVYFYDANDNFYKSVKAINGVYDEDFPLANYARIVIHPEIPEGVNKKDFRIAFYEKAKYAKKVTITVAKEQKNLYENSINLYEHENSVLNKTFQTTINPATWDSMNLIDYNIELPHIRTSNKIVVDGSVDYYDVYVYLEAGEEAWPMAALFGADGKCITEKDSETGYVYSSINPWTVTKPVWVRLTIAVPELDSYEGVHLMVELPEVTSSDAPSQVCYIYGYNK